MHEILKSSLANYISLTGEQWTFVLRHFKPKVTKRNEILLEKEKTGQYIYFVVKGCLRIFLVNDDGQESTRMLIFEGTFGTAFPSFVLRQPSAAAIQSIEASNLLQISYQDFQTLLEKIPGWEKMYRIILEKAYIESILRIESLISMDSKERYNILMEENPKLIQRLPGKIIADYLGISQETLSRLKSKEVRKSGKFEC
ncbi:MAG: Crp/Fnr family transcriptional regulator [Mucilaginibacter sp.]|nr:Crp/Fnr family transcriptional regulator [Mucilaginibacter sp.]